MSAAVALEVENDPPKVVLAPFFGGGVTQTAGGSTPQSPAIQTLATELY